LSGFILAALLRVITHKYHHQLIFLACQFCTLLSCPSANSYQTSSSYSLYFILLSLPEGAEWWDALCCRTRDMMTRCLDSTA
jgi:hypothetical protein